MTDTNDLGRQYADPDQYDQSPTDLDRAMSDWSQRMQDEGAWQEFKGSLKSKWGDLTDDELDQGRGNLEELIGTIKRKTGEAGEVVRDAIRKMAA